MISTLRMAVLVVAAVLFVVGCTDGDDDVAETGDTTSSTSTSADPSSTPTEEGTAGRGAADDAGETDTDTDTDDGDGDGDGDSVDASAPVPDAELPGEVFDLFPYEDAAMTVVGVTHDDVLNVRLLPRADAAVVTELEPLSSGEAIATGRNRQLASGAVWAELSIDGDFGWANTAYLLQAGETVDDTTTLYGDERPTAPSLERLGEFVANSYATPEPESEIVIVALEPDGDVPTVVVDVLGQGDDAVGGYRVRVFATVADDGTATVRNVESTTLCLRGVSDDLCL